MRGQGRNQVVLGRDLVKTRRTMGGYAPCFSCVRSEHLILLTGGGQSISSIGADLALPSDDRFESGVGVGKSSRDACPHDVALA
jgi:hypothetical protein